MIKSQDIYKALVDTITSATTAHNINAPVVADDLEEPIVRPSIKIQIDDDTANRDATHLDLRSFVCRIYYFPPDRYNYRNEHFAMKDCLSEFLKDTLWVGKFNIDTVDGISFSKTDGVLIAELNYEWYEQRPIIDDGEVMETLNLNI